MEQTVSYVLHVDRKSNRVPRCVEALLLHHVLPVRILAKASYSWITGALDWRDRLREGGTQVAVGEFLGL
jgi:hypothetical protein